MLHNITLYCIILHYITLYYTILHYILLYHIALYYIILYHIILYYILYHIILYYIISYYIISYYIISYYIIIILYYYNIVYESECKIRSWSEVLKLLLNFRSQNLWGLQFFLRHLDHGPGVSWGIAAKPPPEKGCDYHLVIQHSHGKWPIYRWFTIKHGDFPWLC